MRGSQGSTVTDVSTRSPSSRSWNRAAPVGSSSPTTTTCSRAPRSGRTASRFATWSTAPNRSAITRTRACDSREDVRELVRAVVVHDRDDHGAEHAAREPGGGALDPVRDLHRDDVARAHAQGAEAAGEPGGEVEHVTQRPAPRAGLRPDADRRGRRRSHPALDEPAERVVVPPSGAAVHVGELGRGRPQVPLGHGVALYFRPGRHVVAGRPTDAHVHERRVRHPLQLAHLLAVLRIRRVDHELRQRDGLGVDVRQLGRERVDPWHEFVGPGWISCTSPIIRASSADTFRAASAIHFAQWVPTRRVSRLTPPLPGIAPSLASPGAPSASPGCRTGSRRRPPSRYPRPGTDRLRPR